MTRMDEKKLEQIAKRLGGRAASGIDVDRTASAVLARLRAEPAAPWWARPALLRLAAAVTFMVGAGLFTYRSVLRDGRTAALPAPVVLQTLSINELEEVLDSLAHEAPAFERAAGMSGLTEDQLRELLREMEG